ncbi:MAG TPA: hypothetical protein VLQ45_09780, partial [Thermoanaerobaculia bacterium]|nr:hypothetical protein [Thermoanaerobaculia bacterium]
LLAGAAGRLSRRPRLAPFVNHPAAGPLTLVPLVFLFGTFGSIAVTEPLDLKAFLMLAGGVGFLVSLLSGLWFYALNLLFNRPERAYTRQVALTSSFILLFLSSQLAQPGFLLGIALSGVLAGPFAGIVIAGRWLAPLRLSDLRDPRLPRPLRKRLGRIALTAILPFGGLALPWWGEVRRRYGSEIDRQAARLREQQAEEEAGIDRAGL